MDKETMQMLQLIIGKLENIETRIGNIETRMEKMESRQNEMFEVVKAIEHSNNTHKAEIDQLIYKTPHIEATINGVGEFIIKQKAV
jgi:hypothetical protein